MVIKGINDFPRAEEEILRLWEEKGIFEKLREKNKGKKRFIFLEGPPTANGMPHMGHALTRAVKDVFLRYKAMDGYEIYPWIAGWDCHGLPVEIEVEKKLGINSKREIEKFGVKKFNRLCRESVFKYRDEWIKMSKRIGFWIDFTNAYVTMEDYYIESVWWALKKIYEDGLLVKDYKVVPYCPRCGTPLSSHEVAQGYRETKDPSIYVKFKVLDEDAYFLVWTTTPWTLPSNLLLAVGEDIDYALVEYEGEKYYIAKARIKEVLGDAKIIREMKGSELKGKRYERLIPFVPVDFNAFYVTTADFVSTEDGTGIVHIAPAFGEDDYNLCKREGVPLIKPVNEEGKFTETPWKGKFVKDADPEIISWLKEQGKLFKKGTVKHTYPFCWRCDTPLLYYALDTWYILMSRKRDDLIRNNEEVNWKPEHLKHGRFGNFLEEVKDWALSRNRYWGTPLPIWKCPDGHVFIPEGKEDLLKHVEGEVPEDFELHRPWVDEIVVKCPVCGKPMKREPYLIDVWFDSGSAPFAQFHYPYENREDFLSSFPVDFITEGIDQTRGWFYTLMAISTLVFGKAPYKNVLTLGLILDEDGEKMSKSKGNAVDPMDIISKVGADAVRMYLYASPVWKSRRFSENLVREYMQKTLGTLWNVYVFFKNNAELDGFTPEDTGGIENSLDRWLISRLNSTIRDVRGYLDSYDVHLATRAIERFIDELSNWYLRRSRRRFWKESVDEDKRSAYTALYTSLKTLSILMAPFTPFLSEILYSNLWGTKESVHLEDYPHWDENLIDSALEEEMNVAIRIAEAGRRARQLANVKLRQPLNSMTVVTGEKFREVVEKFRDVLMEEVNVKEIIIRESAGDMVIREIRPNYKLLGPKLKGDLKRVVAEISSMDPEDVIKGLKSGTLEVMGYKLTSEDIQVLEKPAQGILAVEVEGLPMVVYLDTNITRELRLEGLAREVVRRVQAMRKDMDLEYNQKIRTYYLAQGDMKEAIEEFRDYIMRETQSVELKEGHGEGFSKEWDVEGHKLNLTISPLP